ncbi:hypothetical protein D3G46_23870 [Escherichia coli]|nr:hypothetical protein [Escherichia coli]EFN9703668.1 hypothetical protein [Escherichia coli]EHM2993047.1 winged helix-turn-helix domain-containing protein [Escherichia coli]
MKTTSSHNVVLDMLRNIIFIDDESNPLSKNECFIIKHLYERQGTTISRDELTQHCWPGKVVSATSLPVAIKHIRDVLKKIKNEEIIKTHKGEGYSFLPGVIEMKIIDSHPEEKLANTKNTVKTRHQKLQIQKVLTAITIGISMFFWGAISFVTYAKYSNNIKHRYTKSGSLIISTSETTSELTDDLHEGESIFIDDMESTLICDKLTCKFIK